MTGPSEPPPGWQQWVRRRPDAQVLHLDNAAAGRMSLAVRRAVAQHLDQEAQWGAYVAQSRAEASIAAARAQLAALLGLRAEGVAFVESATAGLRELLRAWPLPPGGRVAAAPSEWGPNLAMLHRHGLQTVELATEPDGRVDLPALERTLAAAPPDVVHLTQVASHRGLVQPVAEAAAICRDAGVPLWVDAAQALGHVDTAAGADAVYANSRKWLAGPRGVGLLGVAERWWDSLMIDPPVLGANRPVVQRLDAAETNVAGRVGLGVAVAEFVADGPATVAERLAEVGRMGRSVLAGIEGWEVVDGAAAGGAVTALRPTADADPATVRARLLDEHAILTTAAEPARAPGELTGPLLRVSPQVDCTEADLGRLRDALRRCAG